MLIFFKSFVTGLFCHLDHFYESLFSKSHRVPKSIKIATAASNATMKTAFVFW